MKMGTIAVPVFFCGTACTNAALLPVILISLPDNLVRIDQQAPVLLREAISAVKKLGAHRITQYHLPGSIQVIFSTVRHVASRCASPHVAQLVDKFLSLSSF